MSDIPHNQGPPRDAGHGPPPEPSGFGRAGGGAALRGRWQIPLLVISIAALTAGIWRLRPQPKPPSFATLYAHAVALKDTGLYPEASDCIKSILKAPQLLPEEKRQLHRLMATVIFAHEQGNAVHGTQNAERIIENSDQAVAEPGLHDAEMHWIRAQAWEWLRKPGEALADYRQVIAKDDANSPRLWPTRKRILEIQRTIEAMTAQQLHAAYDTFISTAGISDELRYWAAEQKVELWAKENQHAEAEKFLAGQEHRFEEPEWRNAYQYLQALAWYRVRRLDDAERQLRVLRDGLTPGQPLYASTGWLLGKVLEDQESPEPALGFFEDVLNNTTPGPYRTAALLGRAETLASLNRFDQSTETYRQTLRLAAEDPYSTVVDLQVIRQSTTALYQSLLTQGKLREAIGYLRIAGKLIPPSDNEAQILHSERLAELALSLGKWMLESPEAASGIVEPEAQARVSGEKPSLALRAPASPDRAVAHGHFIEAGQEYLRLAKLVAMDDDASASAAWHAADAFDLAGERLRTMQVLEALVRSQPDSMRAPMALLRLGQTYQAGGEYDKAIAVYQQNLVKFPRTPSAVASLVPLSQCFLARGETDKAEQVLLRIVVRQPDDPLTLIEPKAAEYRDALFGLGDLYARRSEYEKSIARYEEAIERYPDDPELDRAMYLLADVYRRSAARIRDDLSDPKNILTKDDLQTAYRERLQRARRLYDQVIERYRARPEDGLAELDRIYLKLSHFYRGDVVYDLSRLPGQPDLRGFAEALELYDRAAWLYQSDPMAMTAYVQMIHCHLSLGSTDKARMTLQRARWTLKSIPEDRFVAYSPSETRTFWEEYLTWLERTPTLGVETTTAPA